MVSYNYILKKTWFTSINHWLDLIHFHLQLFQPSQPRCHSRPGRWASPCYPQSSHPPLPPRRPLTPWCMGGHLAPDRCGQTASPSSSRWWMPWQSAQGRSRRMLATCRPRCSSSLHWCLQKDWRRNLHYFISFRSFQRAISLMQKMSTINNSKDTQCEKFNLLLWNASTWYNWWRRIGNWYDYVLDMYNI